MNRESRLAGDTLGRYTTHSSNIERWLRETDEEGPWHALNNSCLSRASDHNESKGPKRGIFGALFNQTNYAARSTNEKY